MPATRQHRFAELRDRLLACTLQHQIRRISTVNRRRQCRYRIAKLLTNSRVVGLTRHNPTNSNLWRKAFNHRLRHRAIAN